MTARTHDLFGFTALLCVVSYFQLPEMTLGTALVSLGAGLLGALTPDLDEATSEFWQKIPAGTFIGGLIKPLIGGHRLVTHSLLGMFVIGKITEILLLKVSGVLLVDMSIVWGAFMIGFLSHLIADSFTKDGVPWLFPLPFKLGFPPFKFMRITTGEFSEKAIVFPGLLFLNGYIIYSNYPKLVSFISKLVNFT